MAACVAIAVTVVVMMPTVMAFTAAVMMPALVAFAVVAAVHVGIVVELALNQSVHRRVRVT